MNINTTAAAVSLELPCQYFTSTLGGLNLPEAVMSSVGGRIWRMNYLCCRRQQLKGGWSEDHTETICDVCRLCAYFKIHFLRGDMEASNQLLCFSLGTS